MNYCLTYVHSRLWVEKGSKYAAWRMIIKIKKERSGHNYLDQFWLSSVTKYKTSQFT